MRRCHCWDLPLMLTRTIFSRSCYKVPSSAPCWTRLKPCTSWSTVVPDTTLWSTTCLRNPGLGVILTLCISSEVTRNIWNLRCTTLQVAAVFVFLFCFMFLPFFSHSFLSTFSLFILSNLSYLSYSKRVFEKDYSRIIDQMTNNFDPVWSKLF
jgi:hypothetical protein